MLDFMMADYQKTSQCVNIICDETLRYSFVSHLTAAVRRAGISVFTGTYSDGLNQGATVSVVVFSETSKRNKIDKHFELLMRKGEQVIPVIYGVDPSSVIPTNVWLKIQHQSRNSISDSELVEDIVRDVYGKLFPTERIGIYSRLLEIENLLCKQPWGVRTLGIWGMPGIGKTTLAKAVFDEMFNDYDASCFIDNFDEALHQVGPNHLIDKIFGKILREKFGESTYYLTRLSLLKDKLCNKRILLILDDVHNPLVAESFLGKLDWIGPGSLIIITSRYKQVFSLCHVNQMYKVQGLNEHEALQLFSQNAFEKDFPELIDRELSMKVISYANGNPLALRTYGQELKWKKSEMEAAFLKLKQCPPQNIKDMLKSVYSTLGDNEKFIFLTIACFFKGENVDYVMKLLKGCGYFPRLVIDVLVEKCLATIAENTLQMNDLIQDIIREIISGEQIQVKKCATLWQSSSIRYLLEDKLKADGESKESLECLVVAEDIKGISLDTSNLIFDVNPDAFINMNNLRFLKVYNSDIKNVPGLNLPKGLNSLPCKLRLLHWENYAFESLPQGFDLRELIELNMPYSQLTKLTGRTNNFKMLKRIKLCHSQQLFELNIHESAQNIELIDLQGCTILISIPVIIKFRHLRVLNLSGCRNINIFPELPPNIEELDLQGTSIEMIPDSIVTHSFQPICKELLDHMKHFPGLEHIDLESATKLIKVNPESQDTCKLVRLNMKDCIHLRSLPGKLFDLTSLQVLDLSGCSELEKIEDFPRNIRELYLAGTSIRKLPKLPENLEFLNAHDCNLLKSVYLDFEQLPRHYMFSSCFSLPLETISLFLEKCLTRVIRLAKEENQVRFKAPAFNIGFPASVCQRSTLHWQASSFAIVELAPSMRKSLAGFVMSVLVSFQDDCHNVVGLGIRCICTWETKIGQFDTIERTLKCWAPREAPGVEKDHMFFFYDAKMHPGAGSGMDQNRSADQFRFEFQTVSGESKPLGGNCKVTQCNVKVIMDSGVSEEISSIVETRPSVSNIFSTPQRLSHEMMLPKENKISLPHEMMLPKENKISLPHEIPKRLKSKSFLLKWARKLCSAGVHVMENI